MPPLMRWARHPLIQFWRHPPVEVSAKPRNPFHGRTSVNDDPSQGHAKTSQDERSLKNRESRFPNEGQPFSGSLEPFVGGVVESIGRVGVGTLSKQCSVRYDG